MKTAMIALALLCLAAFASARVDPSADSFQINRAETQVTLPLYLGRVNGDNVWYVVLDASDGGVASDLGVNRASKLENARNSAGVSQVSLSSDASINFEATVDFRGNRVVVPDPNTGFPPLNTQPPAQAFEGYTPIIQFPNGTLLNAPHVANKYGVHPRVVSINYARRYVIMDLSDGFANGKAVLYLTTDASSPVAAALENVPYVPRLQLIGGLGEDGSDSPRASLGAFVNGETGRNNPQRQGLNSALLDGLDPLNVLSWLPNQGRYSPLWDVFLLEWRDLSARERVEDWGEVRGLADEEVGGPGNSPFGPADFIVNCPIVAEIDD